TVYVDTLRAIASSTAQSVHLRGRAIRLLSRYNNSRETVRLVVQSIETRDRILVDAAAHVVAAWRRKRRAAPREAARELTRFAAADPRGALNSPGVLRALAVLSTRSARVALRTLQGEIRRPEERTRFLAAVGDALTERDLARLVRDVMDNPTLESVWALRG